MRLLLHIVEHIVSEEQDGKEEVQQVVDYDIPATN